MRMGERVALRFSGFGPTPISCRSKAAVYLLPQGYSCCLLDPQFAQSFVFFPPGLIHP
jgi:hypothetical protein